MKVNTSEQKDRFGVYPACRVSGKDASPQNIHEYLYRHNGCGYIYAVILNCMPDEFEILPKETEVYFLDDILGEVVDYAGVEKTLEYIGVDRAKQWLEKRV